MAKFCSNCGKELEPGATACPECGAEVPQQQTAQQKSDNPFVLTHTLFPPFQAQCLISFYILSQNVYLSTFHCLSGR